MDPLELEAKVALAELNDLLRETRIKVQEDRRAVQDGFVLLVFLSLFCVSEHHIVRTSQEDLDISEGFCKEFALLLLPCRSE